MTYKRKRRLQGMTAWVLALCLTVGMFGSLPVLADQAPEAGAQLSEQKWTPDEEIRLHTVGDMSLEELSDAVLPEADKTELVSEAAIAEKGHVNRLREQEPDLNTVIFQNRDGTKTMYQYGSPVKYIDETGKVRDKRNTLGTDVKTAYAVDYGYVNSENDIRTYFPKTLRQSKGVLLENGDVKLELRPVQSVRRQSVAVQAAQQSAAAPMEHSAEQAELPSSADTGAGAQEQQVTSSQPLEAEQVMQAASMAGEKKTLQVQAAGERDTQVMEYAGVFGAGTTLRYTPTFEGFKEDIILSSASSGHEFVFEVDAGGLQAVAENGSIQFIDPLTGDVKAGMDPIYVYDSYTGERTEENPHDSYDNQLLCEPAEGGKYRITIVADEDFLNDPDTVYPVYVDPTITVNTWGSGWTKTIEDAVVFSGQPYSNQNNNKYMHVGYVDTTYGVGRALVKFPGLTSNATFQGLENSQITSVKFYIYKTNDVNSTEDTIVGVYRYTGPGWTETDATYCSVDTSSFTDLQDEQVVYGTQQKYIGFDITGAAMLWRTNSAAANKGILLKNIDEYSRNCDRNFLSTRMGTNKPYVQVNYNVIPVSGIQLSSTNLDMLVNDTATLTATVLPSNATHKEVCFVSSDPNVVSVGSYSGMLCAQSTGTATITAWSVYDISKIATCTVKVRKYTNEQVYVKLDQLHLLAKEYDNSNAMKLTLQFIRKHRYNTANWQIVAGTINQGFVNYVLNHNRSVYDFFEAEELYIEDSQYGNVDLIHLAATMNGIIVGGGTYWKSLVVGAAHVRNLAGWAGDLQTLVVDVYQVTSGSNDYLTFYNKFMDLIGNENYSFGMSDLLADIDASNFADDWMSLYWGNNLFGTSIKYYYSNINVPGTGWESRSNIRFNQFVGTDTKIEFNDTAGLYTSQYWMLNIQWPLYESEASRRNITINLTPNQTKAARDAFTDYIWAKYQNERNNI